MPFHSTEPPLWRQIMRQNFTKWKELAKFLELSDEQQSEILPLTPFTLNLPKRLAEKVDKRTLDDPILKQFLPTRAETVSSANFLKDPVGDRLASSSPKLLHKYQGRALILSTSSCAMHCRYCFRRNFDYEIVHKGFDNELKLIAADTSLREIILSGGDPLSLSDENLSELLDQLNAIEHIKHIRFHTRFPIGIPERIDSGFLALFSKIKKKVWVVIHSNHPKELDSDVLTALKLLQEKSVILLNQSVLLRGVNDNAETLIELCEKLVDNAIHPYYLHQLDRVEGSSHFEVEEETGRFLMGELQKALPGYAIPKYVREVAGERHKIMI